MACLNLHMSLYHSIISINPGAMQFTYQGQAFKIDLAATYQQCRSLIIEKANIGEHVIWKIEYKDEDQQFYEVDSDDNYTTMLEQYEALERAPHVYVKVDPASCPVSEIKERQSHQLDSDLEASHDVVDNDQEKYEDAVEQDQPEQSDGEESEEKEQGGLSGSELEEAENNQQEEQIEDQEKEEEENEGSKIGLEEDEIQDQQEQQEPQKDESQRIKSNGKEQSQAGENSPQESQDSPQQEEDDKQQENNPPPPNHPKEDTKQEEIKDNVLQANQSTVTNLHKQEQKDRAVLPPNHGTTVQRQLAQQVDNHKQKSESQGQVQSPLESERPSEQNKAIAEEVVEGPVKPAAEEPSPHQQIKQEQGYQTGKDKVQPYTIPIQPQSKKSAVKQNEPQTTEVLPRRDQRYQLICSFCRSETQHLQYLCGFHNIITCEQCEDNWSIVSKKKRVGSKIRSAPTRRTGLKPCSFCGQADGLSKLNTFDISMCAGCETKWEFVPSRRHI